jgi:hypothetical protein
METVSNFLFNNMSRIGNDNYDVSNRTIENTNASNYMLENYTHQNNIGNTISMSCNQPNVFCQGSPAGGIDGNNIDENSVLKFAPISKQKERVGAQERLFLTVPYLGKGPSNPILEAQLQQGEHNTNRKSVDPNSEVSFTNYSYVPLIPSIEASVTNPANLVEGVAAEGWIRGGLPSRELTRDHDYAIKHTPNQYA